MSKPFHQIFLFITEDLKQEFCMTFGDWTLFVLLMKVLRQRETESVDDENQTGSGVTGGKPHSNNQFNVWKRR